jgi:hypothetical protein
VSRQLLKGTQIMPFLGHETKSFRFREHIGSTEMCDSVLCENVSLRNSLVKKWVWSPDRQAHGELIRSRVSPNRASDPGIIWTHYDQEMPLSP